MNDTEATMQPAGTGLLEPPVKPLLEVVPCDLKTANEFVRRLHRHSRPVVGHKFAVAVAARFPIGDARPGGAGYGMHMDCIVGVAIVGRPVAPRLDDGRACEPLDSGSTKRTRAEAPRCGTAGRVAVRSQWGMTSWAASGDGLAEA
jgi:hypothetical protein